MIDEAVIWTPSHRVHSHSSFDLTFSLHQGRQKVRLVLDPNHDLIHDDFAVTFLRPDGTVRTTEKIPRTEDKVYRGTAFVERPDQKGWSAAGWARIYIHHDGPNPIFDGSFRIDGDGHHVQTASSYHNLKDARDAPLEQNPTSGHAGAADERMVVWRDSDVMDLQPDVDELRRRAADSDPLCSADSLDFNNRFESQLASFDNDDGYGYFNNNNNDDERAPSSGRLGAFSLFGRQSIDGGGGGSGLNLINSIGSLDGCPTTRRVALVGLATDCNYWDGFSSSEDLRRNVISMVNRASQLYESTFRISLGIQNLTVSDRSCPETPSSSAPWNVGCGSQTTISDRLNTFSRWRGQFRDDNAYWTLLTKCSTDSAVGLAWRGQLCRPGSGSSQSSSGRNETVAATNVVVKTDTEWQIFAHETGHTFGAVHDCTDQNCPVSGSRQSCCPLSRSSCSAGGQFMMNPSTGRGITQFSPCSIGNICSALRSRMVRDSCLTDNRNVQTVTGSQCGNGIVETGEDCDCGGEQGCRDNRCCNPRTCRFVENAVCDPSNEDCCTDSCRFASNGTVCRRPAGECDLEEQCPGDRASCPDDRFRADGDACGGDGAGLSCASGQCTSRDRQCRNLANSLSGANNTRACDNSGCLVACTSPDLAPGGCMTFNQNFLDGTSCGSGGRCSAGSCQGSSSTREIGDWIRNHRNIFIPVVTIVGSLVLLAIACCCIGSCRRRRRRRQQTKAAAEMSVWGGPPAAPGLHPASSRARLSHAPAPDIYPPPPPAYTPVEADGREWRRGRGVRYA